MPKSVGTVCIACKSKSCAHLRPPLAPSLAPHELAIIRLVATADPNKTIAWKLGLTEASVKIYVSKIYRKMGYSCSGSRSPRTSLASWALANEGLIAEVGDKAA